MTNRTTFVPTLNLLLLLLLLLCCGFAGGCSEGDNGADDSVSGSETQQDSGTATDASQQGADTPSLGDQDGKTALAWTADETDKQLFVLLDDLHEKLAKTPVWKGFPLTTTPLYLVRRSLKGTAKYGLLTHAVGGPSSVVATAAVVGKHTVWPMLSELDFLASGQDTYSFKSVGGVIATFAAYSGETVVDPASWLGEVGNASFVRMRDHEQKWAPVEGCGLSKFPRVAKLIELTLLEDALLIEMENADAADLPNFVTEIMALRELRVQSHAMTARIDNDGENRFGMANYARMMLPVIAGARTPAEHRTDLLFALNQSMTMPLVELDNHLLWRRHLFSSVVMLKVAKAAGVDPVPYLEAGKTVHDALVDKLGAADLSKVAAIRDRHDTKLIDARTAALMAYKSDDL